MRVSPSTDFPDDRLGTPGIRWLAPPETKMRRAVGAPQEVTLERGREVLYKGNPCWLVKLQGYDSPEAVDELRGHRLLVPSSERPPLEDEDEFYVQDLVGLRVLMHADGSPAGTVTDIFDGTGTHDVLQIEVPGRPTYMLPFARELVPVVDLAAGVMRIEPPEGLLDLAVSGPDPDEDGAGEGGAGESGAGEAAPRRRRRRRQRKGGVAEAAPALLAGPPEGGERSA
ncbi:CGLD31 [Auxenochlorella protothecoides x Auxenochlorella symbiontica]